LNPLSLKPCKDSCLSPGRAVLPVDRALEVFSPRPSAGSNHRLLPNGRDVTPQSLDGARRPRAWAAGLHLVRGHLTSPHDAVDVSLRCGWRDGGRSGGIGRSAGAVKPKPCGGAWAGVVHPLAQRTECLGLRMPE
jgi:hypothetical protein